MNKTVGLPAAAENRSLGQTNCVIELQHVAELLGAIWKDECLHERLAVPYTTSLLPETSPRRESAPRILGDAFSGSSCTRSFTS
jgi:hypothetical protein